MTAARLIALSALTLLAGCESFITSPLFASRSYGYAYPGPAPLAPAPLAPAPLSAPASPAPAPPTGPSAAAPPAAPPADRAVILPVVAAPVEGRSSAPVYDHNSDPTVTSVLLPPVRSGSWSNADVQRTADGRAVLPPMRQPRVIDLHAVLDGLDDGAAAN